ncbi:CDP-diacylglycerol--serine O-phosphatidyltransferase [Pararhizobium haloflavum]|uniref:CDP-diacylglycerol--serine O-phosphatidyltransferase n=1 Tax=Pararhizobium haloflavum TaxID=2037914 RepID=UPI000C1A8A77|nr:CDP-diacylglycerol--serine O-phosphatidyltransferase [Pararhizobium haloflavum]
MLAPLPDSGTTMPARWLRWLPNVVTAAALCFGLLSIRFSLEGAFVSAVIAICIAAILDGCDGRLARRFGVASRFGEEFDSLADFLSFGVAPVALIFVWAGESAPHFLHLCLMTFALASAMRLARFNTSAGEDKEAWQRNYFIGMPTPCAAIAVLAPTYLIDAQSTADASTLIAAYIGAIALLMVSTVPTYSGKCWKLPAARAQRRLVIAAMAGLIVFAAIAPRSALLAATLGYFASIPVSWHSYRRSHGE